MSGVALAKSIGQHTPSRTITSKLLNSQRKNAPTLRPKVTTSWPASGVRKPWSTWYRRCSGLVGS